LNHSTNLLMLIIFHLYLIASLISRTLR
jgi:hypothetical protein